METDKLEDLTSKTRLTNYLLTMLVTMVAGYFLQQGVNGLLWLVCWVVTLYGLSTLSVIAFALIVSGVGFVIKALAAYSKLNAEEARLKVLNDIYNSVNNKNKE
jgi:hypothetical protein